MDVARWEQALNGKAVRILHSINDGEYGGETIAIWDENKGSIVYHYFTTAGSSTTGTMVFKDGKMVTNETVSGSAGGVTEVRGTAEIGTDGTFRMKTEYLKEGKWQPARCDLPRRRDRAGGVQVTLDCEPGSPLMIQSLAVIAGNVFWTGLWLSYKLIDRRGS